MRVITGSARGRKLAPALLAGSGQLGIEALSRGAAECYFVDSAAVSIKAVRQNVESTGFEDSSHIMNMPFSAFLKSTRATFDIAILDPPYNYKLIQKALPLLTEKMSERGVIVCEHEKECVLPHIEGGFELVRLLRHGRISLSIYRRSNVDDQPVQEI